MSDALPIYLAAGLALAWVAYVSLRPQTADDSGAITTDDANEGTLLDVQGLWSEAVSAVSPANFANPTALSSDGLEALMDREGFSSTPYYDFKGSSIGYGHLIKPGESFASISQEVAAQLLASDVAWAVDAVRSAVLAPVDQNQFDALVSFCFNVGAGAFSRSTLVRRINAFDPNAADEFGRWVYAGGRVNDGLIARRQSERAQYES